MHPIELLCYCWDTSAKIWTLFEQLVQVFTTDTEDLASEGKGSFELISSKLDRQWGKDETVDRRSFFRKGPIMPFLLKVSTSKAFSSLNSTVRLAFHPPNKKCIQFSWKISSDAKAFHGCNMIWISKTTACYLHVLLILLGPFSLKSPSYTTF